MLCVVKKKKKTKQVEAMFDQNIITRKYFLSSQFNIIKSF